MAIDLLIDLGNTQQKIAVVDSGNILEKRYFDNFTLHDLDLILSEYKNINACILSSVINHSQQINDFLSQKLFFIELNASTPLPIKNCYATPESLGKDRLSAAIGAWSLKKNQNVLSIDAGTALKFDFVNEKAEYLGGAISPGVQIRLKALHTFTDKLPLIEVVDQENYIGTNTQESILSGVLYGIAAEVDGIIERYKMNYKNLEVIITGGEAIYFDKYLKNRIFAVPNLVLLGLNEILKFNKIK